MDNQDSPPRRAPVPPDRSRYLHSLADELNAPANRIRNLIGGKHWPTDGAYKEYLLANVIRRHCPSALIVARGFVVSDVDPTVVSREQDLLIIDITREAPLFYEAGIVVTFPRHVVGAISVKSAVNKAEVEDVISVLNSLRTAADHPSLEPSTIWCGAYAYSPPNNAAKVYEHIAGALRSSPVTYRRPQRTVRPVGPDCIVAGPDLLWTIDHERGDNNEVAIRGYSCDGLSAAFLLGQLLNHISSLRDRSESDFGSLLSSAISLDPAEHIAHM